MKYDMDDLSSKDAYNESTAYKASGDQHKNQLVGQEGMINIVSFASKNRIVFHDFNACF